MCQSVCVDSRRLEHRAYGRSVHHCCMVLKETAVKAANNLILNAQHVCIWFSFLSRCSSVSKIRTLPAATWPIKAILSKCVPLNRREMLFHMWHGNIWLMSIYHLKTETYQNSNLKWSLMPNIWKYWVDLNVPQETRCLKRGQPQKISKNVQIRKDNVIFVFTLAWSFLVYLQISEVIWKCFSVYFPLTAHIVTPSVLVLAGSSQSAALCPSGFSFCIIKSKMERKEETSCATNNKKAS